MSEALTIKLAMPVNERDHVMAPTNALVTVANHGESIGYLPCKLPAMMKSFAHTLRFGGVMGLL